jgi:hypothetical protein
MKITDKHKVAEIHENNKQAMFDAMRKAGVARAVAEFDGSGDSGDVVGVECFDSNDNSVDVTKTLVDRAKLAMYSGWDGSEYVEFSDETPTLEKVIDHYCYRILEGSHGGWEINEGAYGSLEIDAEAQTSSLEFNQRYESIDTSYEEF